MKPNRGKKSVPKQLLKIQGNAGASSISKVIILLLIAAGAITTAIIIATTLVSDSNESVSKAYCREILTKSTDAFAKQACKLQNCPFDISACTLPCPFGYSEGLDGCPNACTCASESKSFQLDIAFEKDDIQDMLELYGYLKDDVSDFTLQRSGAFRGRIWNNVEVDGRFQIPYDYNQESKNPYSQKDISYIESLLKVLSGLVCLDFKKRTTERYFLWFTSDEDAGCSSDVGRASWEQKVYLYNGGCLSERIVLHEIMHALGFIHEQNRPDRDLYVTINYLYIKKGYEYNFKKIKGDRVVNLGINYNYQSVMHYGSYEFSGYRNPTIVHAKTGKPLPVVTKFNVSDQLNIYRRYKCEGIKEPVVPGTLHWKDWSLWTSCRICDTIKTTRRRECDSTQKECAILLENKSLRGIQVEDKRCSGSCTNEWTKCTKTCGIGMRYRFVSCQDNGVDELCKELMKNTEESCNLGKCSRTVRPEGSSGGSASDNDNKKKGGVNKLTTIRPVRSTTRLTPSPTIRQTTRLSPSPTIRPTTRLTPSPTIRPTTRLTPSPTIRPTTPSTFVGKSVPECKAGNEEPRAKYVWAPWSPWTGCPNCAKTGTGQRSRECIGGGLAHCLFAYNKRGDVASEQRPCSKLECAPQPSGGWSQWNDCSRKCGGGEKMRFRICNNCYQLSFETVSCNEQPCTDKDYHWEEWNSWTGCDDCEVEKFVSRRRNCVGGFPGDCRRSAQQCDKSIVDLEFQSKPCNKLVCKNIITRQWSQWGSWHRCSASCDEGYRIRYRTCSGGNLGCGFHLSFSFQKCNISPCEAKNKQWSSWTVVGDCSATCGIGLVVKVRRCLHASNTCPGKSVDTRDCNNNQIPCPKAQADNQANSTGPLGMFNKIAITVPNNFCNDSNNAVWTFGYLNSDKRFDLICKRDTNLEASYSRSSTIFENIDWRQDLSKCTQGDIYLADFNGDIQDDFVCQNKRNKVLTINLWANERFSSDPLYEGEFCTGEDDRVMFLDANGDRKNDILCDHGRFNGYAILNLYDAA